MSTLRHCVLLAAFSAIALAVVYLRTEQTRAAARALATETRWVEVRRDLWRLQTAVARLKAPGRIRERVGWFDAELAPPAPGEAQKGTRRLVYSHSQE